MAALTVEDGLTRLAALGFLKTEGSQSVVLHRLLVAFLYEKMIDDPAAVEAARTSIETAMLQRLETYQKNEHLLIQLPFPATHLQHAAKTAMARVDERAARLTTTWGYYLYLNSDLQNAAPYLSRARVICEQVYGNEHPETAVAYSRDGWVHMHTGDYSGAKLLYEQALAIQENLPEPDPLKLANCYRDIGVVHWRQGQYAQARQFHEKELALRESAVGKAHPLTAQSLSSLGIILGQLGNLEQARSYQERALAAVGDQMESADTARLLSNLATACSRLGDNEAARKYSEQALYIRERIFGPTNRLTANSQHNLGMLLVEFGEYETAYFHLEQALAVRKKLLGEEHILTARSLSFFGDLQRRMGQFEAAQATLEKAVGIYEAVQPTHAQMAQALNYLGDLFIQTGNLDSARSLLDRALDIWQQEKHSGRPDKAHTLISLGDWFKAKGDIKIALDYYQRAGDILEAAVLPTHPDLQRVKKILAAIQAQV
jgi:tetratricopeptide (TPR) repeat protein